MCSVQMSTNVKRRKSKQNDIECNTISRAENMIHNIIQKSNRIDVGPLRIFFKELRNNPEAITENRLQLLMWGTGELVQKFGAVKRHKLYLEIWDWLLKTGYPISINTYNASIRSRLENNQTIDPEQELKTMLEKFNLTANKRTHVLLIKAYCKQGNIQEARVIVEHMKAENLFISEEVHNDMIAAHLVNGDVSAAQKVLESMSDDGVMPTMASYQLFLNYHAAQGDFPAIQQTIHEAREAIGDFYHHKHYLEMITHAAVKGHSQLVDQLIEDMPKCRNYYQHLQNTVFQLAAAGVVDDSYKLIKTTDVFPQNPEDKYKAAEKKSILDFYLLTLVQNEVPLSDVLRVLDNIKSDKFVCSTDISYLLHYSSLESHPEYFLALLNYAEKQEMPINVNYYRLLSNVDGYNLDIAMYLQRLLPWIPERERFMVVFRTYAEKQLIVDEPFDGLKEKLQNIGVMEKVIDALKFLKVVRSGHFKEALSLVNTMDPQVCKVVSSFLASGFKVNPDCDQLTELLASLPENGSMNDTFALCFLHVSRVASEDLQVELASKWRAKGFQISYNMYTSRMKPELSAGVLTELDQLCDEAKAGPRTYTQYGRTELQALSTSQLEELFDNRDFHQSYGITKQLFKRHSESGNIEKTEYLWNLFLEKNYTPDLETWKYKAVYEATFKHNIKEADLILKKLIAEDISHRDLIWLSSLTVAIADVHVQRGNLEDAIKTLQIVGSPTTANNSQGDAGYRHAAPTKCVKTLLEHSMKHGGVDTVMPVLQCLRVHGYISSLGFSSIVKQIVTHVASCYKSADLVSLIKSIYLKFDYLPKIDVVLLELIKSQNHELLQQVLDMYSQCYGETQMTTTFLVALLEAGKTVQARKVIKDIRYAENAILRQAVERLVKEAKPQIIMDLVYMMKAIPMTDLHMMLDGAIDAYCENREWKKALDVLSTYEELDIEPWSSTLLKLHSRLHMHGIPAPFERPNTSTSRSQETPAGSRSSLFANVVPSNHLETKFLHTLQSGRHHDIVTFFQRVNRRLSNDFIMSCLIVLNQLCDPVANDLIRCLQNVGRDDILKNIDHMPQSPDMKKRLSHVKLSAMLEKNKLSELVDTLTQDEASLHSFTATMLCDLHDKSTDHADTVRKLLVERIESSQSTEARFKLVCMLVTEALLMDNMETAHSLVKNYKSECEQINFRGLETIAKKRNQAKYLYNLLELLKVNKLHVDHQLYAALMDIQCNNKDFEGAEQTYIESASEGATIRWLSPIKKLKAHLDSLNKPLPWDEKLYNTSLDADSSSLPH